MPEVSPEEKLFRVIRDQKDAPTDSADLPPTDKMNVVGRRGLRQFLFGVNPFRKKSFRGQADGEGAPDKKAADGLPLRERIKGRLSLAVALRLQDIDPIKKTFAYGLRPETINSMLAGLLVVSLSFVVYQGVFGRPNIAAVTQAISKIKYRPPRRPAIETFKPVDFYLEEQRKRDIFKPSPRPEDKVVVTRHKEVKPAVRLEDLARDLKLVGISWGASPKVMIKDNVQGVTYFLRQGEMVGTSGIKVKTIFKDKVVLSYEEQEMELL
ncbi:MAG: hypothetical protein ACE5GG_01805 [Candidatus Omnitrophota bacterium]